MAEVLWLQLQHHSFQWISRTDFFRTNRFDLLTVKGLSRVYSSTTVSKHQFFGAQLSLWCSSQCVNYRTAVLISHASTVMLKVLQARFHQYMNQELLPNVQAGFRKVKWTRDQIANISLITEKGREFQKKKTKTFVWLWLFDYVKAFDCVDYNKLEDS